MRWFQKYRLLVVLFAVGTLAGVREYVISRDGAAVGGLGACEASAASCFSIQSSALATNDPEFWKRHARMVEVVTQLNPDDPDTDFLEGMEALAAGDEKRFVEHFETAISKGVKHNTFLLQFYAQYLLDRGANWERVDEAVNRWRENHQLSTETIALTLSAGPRTRSDEIALAESLSRVPWLADYRLERVADSGAQQWRLHMAFRPGRVVDMREAVAAVTVLSIPEAQRRLFRVTCRTLVDCAAVPR